MANLLQGQIILETPMPENEAGARNIREYLITLAYTVWNEEEGFSGKRPFGNSGWKYEIAHALAYAYLIPSKCDEDGNVVEVEWEHVERAIKEAFSVLFNECKT